MANNDRQWIESVSRDLVGQVAPQELPAFGPISDAYFRNPTKVLEGRTSKDEMLGFGIETGVALITPVIIEATKGVISYLKEEVKKSAKTESTNVISRFMKKVFGLFFSSDKETEQRVSELVLTPKQLKRIREIVEAEARRFKIPHDEAVRLSDAMIGRIATSQL